jgi:hypothetical protein
LRGGSLEGLRRSLLGVLGMGWGRERSCDVVVFFEVTGLRLGVARLLRFMVEMRK